MASEKYQAYLCSREWGLRREAVTKRSGGLCERCYRHRGTAVHHKTYARIYHEPLADLIHLCDECHEFMHGRGDHDPRDDGILYDWDASINWDECIKTVDGIRVTANRQDTEVWRLERLSKVVIEIRKRRIKTVVHALHDHKGILSVHWASVPVKTDFELMEKIWSDEAECLGEHLVRGEVVRDFPI